MCAGKYPYHTFSGLKSMEKYWFRVVSISHDGEYISSPVTNDRQGMKIIENEGILELLR
ncbi:hypothetical protein [Niastella populi]|uniref:hypothetical protein n=1 Tax=Niastella populi TaxID=550983 RepID=UPI0013FD6613|nr:hypothetical protein [Niastella populi]